MATIEQISKLLDDKIEKQYVRIQKEIDNTKKDLSSKMDSFFSEITTRIDSLENTTDKLKSGLQDMEDTVGRYVRRCQILLRNIPFVQNEDLDLIFINIAAIIGFNIRIPPHLYRIISKHKTNANIGQINVSDGIGTRRRLRSLNDGPNNNSTANAIPGETATSGSHIMVNFTSYWERNEFLRMYFKSKTQLNINQIGFKTNMRIYASENLTPRNYKLFLSSLGFKRSGAISNISIRDGLVYVKSTNMVKMSRVSVTSDLDKFKSR